MLHARPGYQARRASLIRTAALALAVVLLGGCSVGSVLESSASVEPDTVPEYKKLIGDTIRAYLPGTPPTAVMEISTLRRALPVEPGDWIACVRRTADKDTVLFAVFLKNYKIETVRRAVLVDKCEAQSYAPLQTPSPPKKVEAKTAERPNVDTPKVEAQKADGPKVDVPKVEAK